MQGLAEAFERKRLDMEFDVGGAEVRRGLGEQPELRGRHRHWAAPAHGVVERHERLGDERMGVDVQRARARDAEDGAQLQMVLQVLADAGQRVQDLAAEAGEDFRAPDPRQLQELRRADRAGGQHDFAARAGLEASPALRVAQAHRAPPLEDQPLGLRAHDEAQVGPFEDGLEEAARRAPAPAAALIDLEVPGALVVAAIEVVDFWDADFGRRLARRVEDRPGQALALDAPFAAGAVQRVRAGVMVLVALEERQDVVPAPALEAELAPAVVIGGLAAHVDHAVDRR